MISYIFCLKLSMLLFLKWKCLYEILRLPLMLLLVILVISINSTAQKMKFSIWSDLLKKSLMENFIFCAVQNGTMTHISCKELQTTYTLSMTSQINVANKQFVPPLNWNNPFSKTYWWLTCRHVDPET